MKYIKTYHLFEADSWAGSLYAYDRGLNDKPRAVDTNDIFRESIPTHYDGNDCGIEFFSFSPVCKNCKSENVDKLN